MSDDKIFIPIKRESPAGRQHLHTMTAGALLPFVQAFLTGLITLTVVVVLFYNLRVRDPWTWGCIIGVIALGLTWFSLQRHWFSLTALEQVTGLDLNRDGYIGEPPEKGTAEKVISDRVVHVRMDDVQNNTIRLFDLPATDEQMRILANGLSIGTTLSDRNWAGRGRPFSLAEFTNLRNELLKRGLVAHANSKDIRQGYALTPAGRALMKHYLSPTPEKD